MAEEFPAVDAWQRIRHHEFPGDLVAGHVVPAISLKIFICQVHAGPKHDRCNRDFAPAFIGHPGPMKNIQSNTSQEKTSHKWTECFLWFLP
jgi:hypothetical protein